MNIARLETTRMTPSLTEPQDEKVNAGLTLGEKIGRQPWTHSWVITQWLMKTHPVIWMKLVRRSKSSPTLKIGKPKMM
jgi:hypothetical protein